jgi:AraC family transcriptional regulator of adaptative response/methylated-DNA-[protein]-cysteine methyltransferase
MKSDQAARDYERIERAIAYLDASWTEQPDLGRVAAHVGVSQSHFDRMFVRWAGVSPMQFLRFLTKENAKHRLREGRSVLDAAFDVGLSGPGRLHDLLVTCEAVTPGEYKSGGAGVKIDHGFAPTPFGECLIASTARGICALRFANGEPSATMLAELRGDWPNAEMVHAPKDAARIAAKLFDPAGNPPRLHLRGTNFQLKVWRALLEIQPGTLVTYQDIAQRIGQPGASRAVGSAVGGNRISFLIPCHRVIRKTGVFGNYRWGAARKLALCGWEGARSSGLTTDNASACR